MPWIGRTAVLLLAGIVVGQSILFGPSLIGRKVLLPTDQLAQPHVYLPATAGPPVAPHDFARSDLVLSIEPARLFDAGELAAGRWPMWMPFQYAGCPDLYPKLSPFWLLAVWFTSPVVWAWLQVLVGLIAGAGVYLFCRRLLEVGPWPSLIAAWCYPLTGSFALWQGFPLTYTLACLPWLLLAVDATVRRTASWAGAALAAATALVLVSGQLDVSGQVLLTSGLYGAWRYFTEFGLQCFRRRALAAGLATALGWALGFMLAAPHLMPLLEYAQTGSRMVRRTAGEEERPPVGLAALPQTVLPDMYGSTRRGTLPLFPPGQGNQTESSAATYAGLLATLLVAPLAWCSRRHRALNVFWILLGFIGLAWALDVPGIVALMRAPPLNMMSHNRFVFATSFALVALTAVGLDALAQGDVRRRWWFWLPAALVAGLCAWCAFRAAVPPEPLATQAAAVVREGRNMGWITDLDQVRQAQQAFCRAYVAGALLCGAALAGWLVLWFRSKTPRWLVPALGALMLADLLWFSYGRSLQSDWALYYPRIPTLEQVTQAKPPGRVVGFQCLPATLAETHGLRDIRGYNGVDPARLIDLMAIAADPRSLNVPYALTQWLIPRFAVSPSGRMQLHPIMDMLNVRYVIFRGTPPAEIRPEFAGDDYWVLVNRNALPRAYVPQRVETVEDSQERLRHMAGMDFEPWKVAYVETPVDLPGLCRGSAEIVDEVPCRITVSVGMQTPGLVVLADLWDKGWNAYLNGRAVPILRVNHALRGVEVPEGSSTLEFRYEPASFVWGLRLAGLAFGVCVAWFAGSYWLRGRMKDDGGRMK